jgi:hypothetical protein
MLGGGIRGFGMLAEYSQTGDKQFYVSRVTSLSSEEPYTPAAVARVFDPHGNIVAVEDFSEQATEVDARVLHVPNGQSGVWRVSFTGGRKGDRIEIRLPQTDVWGVRGEMALNVTEDTPRPAYLWVAPTARKFFMGIESGAVEGISIRSADGRSILGKPGKASYPRRSGEILLEPAPVDQVCRIDIPDTFNGVIDFEGSPGLLCPSEAVAQRLKGGTVVSEGRIMAGPLQARAREIMVRYYEDTTKDLVLDWPQGVPANLKSPELEVLAFGKYGGLNGITSLLQDQDVNLDPRAPYFGVAQLQGIERGDWTADSSVNFLPFAKRFLSLNDAPALAALYAFPGELNPAYKNPQILNRAVLAGLFHFSALQGDDLIRDGQLILQPYPITHTFFIYDSLGQAYWSLKDDLPAEVREVWQQGLMAVGDRVADHQAYQSNQWSHMLLGHLQTYRATKEARFLRYFERGMRAFITGAYGPNSKFGLHPTGFFLEEYGPDGNYERLNLYALMLAYLDYKDLPERDHSLTEAMHAGIEKNLRFKSFFWLPQPDGSVHSPTAFNSRTHGELCFVGYPGEFLARHDFPMGAARYRMTKAPRDGVGGAVINSFIANTPEWIEATIAKGVEMGPDAFDSGAGQWLPGLAEVYAEDIAEAAELPFYQTNKSWELPGLISWNKNNIFGSVFYDVVGSDHAKTTRIGGAPTVLWTPEVGAFLSSMRPPAPVKTPRDIRSPEELTFACVYGTSEDGRFFASGDESGRLSTSDPLYRILIQSEMSEPVSAHIAWGYENTDSGLNIWVRFKAPEGVENAFVNLPILTRLRGADIGLESPQALVFSTDQGSVRIEWPDQYTGRLESSTMQGIQRLVIPLNPDGKVLCLKVLSTSKGGIK